MKPIFFSSAAEFAAWLDTKGAAAGELWLGFFKKGSGRAGISYPEAVDEALCSGWIDGLRKSIDAASFMVRFTPRKPKSIWSAVNIRRAGELTKAGRMKRAGVAAFERRQAGPAPYSFESEPRVLDAAAEKILHASPRALAFFAAQPPSYRRVTSFWVMSAKKEETRARRLRILVESSENGSWIPALRWAANAPGSRSARAATRARPKRRVTSSRPKGPARRG